MNKIFIIEDDEQLASNLMHALEQNHYQVQTCFVLKNWEQEYLQFNPNLVLLDINLQEIDGFLICTRIRQLSTIPIIFITGRDTEEDEIRALNLGGSDYLKKPFSNDLLLAYVAKQLQNDSPIFKDKVDFSILRLDLGKRQAINLHTNESIDLSGMEFQILFYLIGRPESTVSRNELTDYMWSNRCYIDENALNVNLSRLRGKLSQIALDNMLHSIKGEGLCLCSFNM